MHLRSSRRWRSRWGFAPVSILALLLGCQGEPSGEDSRSPAGAPAAVGTTADAEGTVNTELQGKLNIDGSSTVYPISEAAASRFRDLYPGVNIPVGQSGTGNGIERLVKGEIEIADASRPLKPEEFEIAKANKLAFLEIPIAYDGLTIVVHKENSFVDQLTIDELKKIFTSAGSASTWGDVRAGWPNEKIAIFSPGTDSGTFDYFKEVIAGKEGSIRSDISTSEDDNVLVTGVSGSPNAIGFFGVAYYEENKDRLRAVPVVNPELGEGVLPTAENIESGRYSPFSRPLFLYVSAKTMSRPDVKRFVEFYLQNAAQLATQVAYVGLPAEIYQRATENVKKRRTGTHYLTAGGEKRHGPLGAIFVDENRVSF